MSNHLNEAWKRVATQLNEAEEAKQFNFVLESIFGRKVKRIVERRAMREGPGDRQAGVNLDDGVATTPPAPDNAAPASPAPAPADKPAAQAAEPAKQEKPAEKPVEKAAVEPVDPQVLGKFREYNEKIINFVYDRSGNGIPESSPEGIQKFAEWRVNAGKAYDEAVLNAVTVASKNTNDPKEIVSKIFSELQGKATQEGGFPKKDSTVQGYLSEILPLLDKNGVIKQANPSPSVKSAYAAYLAYVFAGGYNFIHSGDQGAVGNVGEAIKNHISYSKKFFETKTALSKELPMEELIDQATAHFAEYNGIEDQDKFAGNLKIFISNIYKLRSLRSKIQKQTKFIQKAASNPA